MSLCINVLLRKFSLLIAFGLHYFVLAYEAITLGVVLRICESDAESTGFVVESIWCINLDYNEWPRDMLSVPRHRCKYNILIF